MRTGHTSAPKGKRVIVHFRDGTKLIGKFIKKHNNLIYLEGHEPFRPSLIRTMSIYKPQTHE